MIVPPNQKQTISFQLSAPLLYALIALVTVAIFGITSIFFYTSKASLELSNYKQMKLESVEQKRKIADLSTQINTLKKDIEGLIETEVKIRDVMRRKHESSPRVLRRRTNYQIGQFNKSYAIADTPEQEQTLDHLLQKSDILTAQVETLKERYTGFSTVLDTYQKRFAATPSIWPVYGKIRSKFGWRTHPLTSKPHLHKGIDIPAFIGAPIKAAADGKVVVTGLRGGDGLVVAINHGHGYLTIYAHASKILVKRGQQVKKGQVIANVGSTGLSTGPHVHYEIRRWRQAISPKPYLNLDLFTASKQIW